MSNLKGDISKYFNKLKLALTIFARIYKQYPYVIEECTTNEEIEELFEA